MSRCPTASRNRPGGPPDFAELLARAEALVPVLRERAGHTEELRQLPEETIEDLHRTGLFRILQPKRVGGSELPFRSIVELVSVIGKGDGSTAWVLANLAAHHWMLGMLPKQAQDEVWGQSPDNLIGSALIFPRGRARQVEGGYRVTGRWPFSSGVDPSSWNLIGAIVHDEETGITAAPHLSAAGQRLHDHRHLARDRPDRHRQQGRRGRGRVRAGLPQRRGRADHRRPEPRQRGQPRGAVPAAGDQPVRLLHRRRSLGIAQGAIDYFAETTRTRTSYYTGRNLADFVTLQIHLAEATAIADAARAVMLLDCDEATRIVEDGTVPSLEQRARYRRDGAYAATLVHPGGRRACSRPPAAARSMQETRCSAPFATSMPPMRITS